MHRLFSLALSLVLFVSSTVFARPDHSVLRDYSRLVVLHQTSFIGASPVGSGSAIIIAPGYALSAWHIFDKGVERGLTVSMIDGGKQVPVTVVAKNEKADLVLISGAFTCPCAPIATVMPDIDTEVFGVGYPLYHIYGLQYVTYGHYQGITTDESEGKDKTIELAATTFPATRGASGGGAFYKQDGVWKLYGIIVAIGASPLYRGIIQEHPFMSFSVPLNVIKELIKGTPVVAKLVQ